MQASSINQSQRSSKDIPIKFACSGTKDVGVIPGWVFNSNINSPFEPNFSFHLKSVLVTPRHPNLSWAIKA